MVSNEEYKEMLDKWKPIIFEKMKNEKISKNDFMDIQSYFLTLIYFYHPLRVDITTMLIVFKKTMPDEKLNYLQVFNKKYFFIINQYKTSITYGQNIIPIVNKELILIM
jgi:hypothetical protein